MKKINSILLIDDDMATNFISKMLIKKADITDNIITALNGRQALDYLTNSGEYENENMLFPTPMLILLDINMPVMDGWEFAKEFQELNEAQKGNSIIIMLTSSQNPDDKAKAINYPSITGFQNKILTMGALNLILKEYFPSYLN